MLHHQLSGSPAAVLLPVLRPLPVNKEKSRRKKLHHQLSGSPAAVSVPVDKDSFIKEKSRRKKSTLRSQFLTGGAAIESILHLY
jgi:hypothetical protein